MRKPARPAPSTSYHSTHRAMLATALLLLLPATALASESDHAGIGRDITVTEGETAGDIACAFCSVQIHGDVHGDVAVLFGSIYVLSASHGISGDVALLGGDLGPGDDSHVSGDSRHRRRRPHPVPGATIPGSQAVFPQRMWMLIALRAAAHSHWPDLAGRLPRPAQPLQPLRPSLPHRPARLNRNCEY